ncbi:DUF6396 domain-containing protein [Paraburkholderia ginsengiterrae]|uniref:DUF6396 domain-containing protein n=1 Tax=Paraburkholderia ginsengiterrae TaxID=1462993 RepID=UPI000AA335FB
MKLEELFLAPAATDEGSYLDLLKDPERSRRYKLVGDFLDRNQLSNPAVPDIDRIVPLPPAQLPPWDGTFEWEKKPAQTLAELRGETTQRFRKGETLPMRDVSLAASRQRDIQSRN